MLEIDGWVLPALTAHAACRILHQHLTVHAARSRPTLRRLSSSCEDEGSDRIEIVGHKLRL